MECSSWLEFFFQSDEQDIIAPYDNFAIIGKHNRAIKFLGIS